MADNTKIEWTDATWNPVTGCSVVSPGCANCYAMRLAGTRLRHHWSRQGLTQPSKSGPVWTGEVRFNEEWLTQPLRWKRPRRVFVCAHGDLFHEGVNDEVIDQVFAVMALARQHTFQVLTKRSARMREYLNLACGRIADQVMALRQTDLAKARGMGPNAIGPLPHVTPGAAWWPLPNVWLGVSVEDQQRADERVPDLLATPAAVRWVSCEPLLGPVELGYIDPNVWRAPLGWAEIGMIDAVKGEALVFGDDGKMDKAVETAKLDWVVAGGESGPGAREMRYDWVASLRDQCRAAGVPFFFKQWGAFVPDWMKNPYRGPWPLPPKISRNPAKWPEGYDPFCRTSDGVLRTVSVWRKERGRLLDGREWSEFPA